MAIIIAFFLGWLLIGDIIDARNDKGPSTMAPRTNSTVSFAKATLPYPLFAADFDPYNRGYLVVGGGGGESKTGVPNQIVSMVESQYHTVANARTVRA